jgi:predicted Rossmann fold nucleotide-binding protein DprA/Smf involved in DNA uptake
MDAMLTVAIVGSRDDARPAAVRAFVAALARKHPGCTVVSGGARGVDSIAAAAREVGLAMREFPADWARLGRGAGFVRNRAIVDAAQVVVAFWDGRSRGTAHTIGLAREAGRQVVVYR